MNKTPLAIVILAAGKGTRMKSSLPKVMHTLAGKPMISILIDQVSALNPDKIIVVTAPDQHALRELVLPHQSAVQERQLGTGDAVKAALPQLENFKGNVLILLGDEPLAPIPVLAAMAEHNAPSVMAIIPPDPAGLGRMVMDEEGRLLEIIEHKDCDEEELEILVCNSGNFCVPAEKLKNWINGIGNQNAQGEYYLTDMPKLAAADNVNFDVFTVPIDHVWGINDRLQLAQHEQIFMDMLRDAHMMNGVRMTDPQSVYFHYDTRIAPDVVIEPSVIFGAGVTVEEGCVIKGFSHIEGAHIRKNTSIGPFARLRPGCDIGEGVRIGNFVEVKKSTIGNGSKINHLSYVGDAVLGQHVNFSAGAITVNYDGYDKFQTNIGDHVMVGCNVNLVAPVSIESGAIIAAGSTITEDVPADALSIARERGTIYKGWANKFRERKSPAKNKS